MPRNFLLEERVGQSRAASYEDVVTSGGPRGFVEWDAAHKAYLERHVFMKPPFGHDPGTVDPGDTTTCPETFRPGAGSRTFEDADLDTHLVRMVAVTDLAWLSGRTPGDIAAHGRRCVGDPSGGSGARGELDAVLEEAFHGPRCDHRPVFAAFYEDLMEELADPASTTWASKVRDRLGLYHLNSWSGTFPIPVFLFRYPLRDVPRERGVTGASRRPLVVPTVLDHRFSEAFCPSPQGMVAGQLVDIGPAPATKPAREVLHPFMPMRAHDLFRVGEVNRPVPPDLGPARKGHLEWLRLLSGDDTHATGTDGDLFVS